MHRFVEWLAQTPLSLAIQTAEWIIPTVQSIHIVAIGVAFGSVFMVTLAVLGWTARDQTLTETTARFGAWLWGALAVLLVTGTIMIIGEPARELLALSFWMKMVLLVIGTGMALTFQRAVRLHTESLTSGAPLVRTLAVVTFIVWVAIVVLGRLIAYDHVWGSWSAALKG